MTQTPVPATSKTFTLRPHHADGAWSTDDRRHFGNAIRLLRELEAVAEQVKSQWPVPLDQTVRHAEKDHPELWALVRRRDQLSDSVRIFAAMAVEGFLNYYGVVRLGEAEFNAHVERLGLIPKLRLLLLVCDSVSVSPRDRIVELLSHLAEGRNALVHPKAKEYSGYVPAEQRPGVVIPGAAHDAVATMRAFFEEFLALVPNAKHLVPPLDA